MYKNASRNKQHAAFTSATQSTRNEAGVDPETYPSNLQLRRRELIEKKQGMEEKLGKLSLQIRIARANYGGHGGEGAVAYEHYTRMEREKANLIREMRQIEKVLSRMKIDMLQQHPGDEESHLAKAFMKMAREMLAEPVFNRILVAATHRIKE